MLRASRLAIVLFGLFLVSGCGSPPFKEFSSKEGKFKVQMPGTPKETKQNAGGMDMHMYTTEQRNGAFAVAYSDSPVPLGQSPAQAKLALDGARDGALKNINAKLTGEKDITLAGKHPGREITADLPDNKGQLKARFYIVDRRIYQQLVMGNKSWVESPDAAKFLDSFALQE
jgi:hypothetical protein